MKSTPIPSKYENVQSMFKACTGFVKPNVKDDILAKQSKRSVQHIRNNYNERVNQIL